MALGCLFLGVGGVGTVVPGLPTTIFWILAAICFSKSCPVLQRWIYDRPRVGPVIEEFVVHRRMARSTKRRAIAGMWAGMGLSVLIVLLMSSPAWVPAVIAACGVGVTLWLVYGIAERVSQPV